MSAPAVSAEYRSRPGADHYMIPTFIFSMWFFGLLSLGVVAGAVWCGHEWYQRSWGWDAALGQSIFAPDFGANAATALFVSALALAIIALAGGFLVRLVLRVTSRAGAKDGSDDLRHNVPAPVSQQRLRRPDGSEIHVEAYGPEDAQLIVLTHGWGLHSHEWNYAKRELATHFRLIVWDEPGLGRSGRPANRDFSVEKFARDLETVLSAAGDRPAILLGHSIGGMITLTFCRLFPETLGNRVAGLVLSHTTPTNPVRTTKGAAFYTAIEKPMLVPLMYLTIALSPLVWLLNWLGYLNGSAHLSTKSSSFAGTETSEQLEFATRFQLQASPGVLARGMLGMMRYDAIPTLASIGVPTLVVAGDKDTVTKPEASERIRVGIAGAQLVMLAPARHLGLVEHHADYAKAVREFAHRIASTRGQLG